MEREAMVQLMIVVAIGAATTAIRNYDDDVDGSDIGDDAFAIAGGGGSGDGDDDAEEDGESLNA